MHNTPQGGEGRRGYRLQSSGTAHDQTGYRRGERIAHQIATPGETCLGNRQLCSRAVTAAAMACGSRSAAGVRTTRQNTGVVKPRAIFCFDHSAQRSTSVRASSSPGQKASSA